MRLKFGFLLLLLGMIFVSNQFLQNLKSFDRTEHFLNPPPLMQHFAFGYRELMADVLWLRAIQDFDVCEKAKIKNGACGKKWLGQMLLSIADLAPQFRMVYAIGPIVLSVLLNDQAHAEELIEKAMSFYPKDWPILYRAASIYHIVIKDKKKAAVYFERAGRNGAPPWVYGLATKLYKETNNTEAGMALLKELENTGVPPEIIKKMSEHIQQ